MPLRFPPGLIDWLNDHAKEVGKSKNSVVQELVEALRDGRLVVTSVAGSNPFPAQQIRLGSTPELPALVCFTPQPPDES